MKKIFILLSIFIILIFSKTGVFAAKYYVSPNGSDAADGLSSDSPWRTIEKVNLQEFKSGDEILFEAGGAWNESLWVRGSGTSESPITIDMYGDGAKPLINGNESSAASVYLCNQQYVHINNLEITNSAEDAAWRYGVYVYGFNAGALEGIELRGLVVHNVSGQNNGSTLDTHWNGGIVVCARGSEKATRFKRLVIDSCTVYSVDRTGIVTMSNYGTSYDKQIAGMSQGLQVTNNTVYDTAGDGIIIAGDYGGEVRGNTVFDTNMRQGGANVGIFTIHCTGTVVSENESYRSRTTKDGFGYDIDGDCDNVVFERNYSHDNEGGFMLLVNHNNNNSVVRYNVSRNDKNQTLAVAAYDNTSENTRSMTAKVYNNTVYCEPDRQHLLVNIATTNAVPKQIELYNNIFYINSANQVLNVNALNTNSVVMSNNLFYGNSYIATLAKTDSNAILENPLLVDEQSGGESRDTLTGLMLTSGSPCIGTGIFVEDNGGMDFNGNSVNQYEAPDIGAFSFLK